jgi:hypothetical protein
MPAAALCAVSMVTWAPGPLALTAGRARSYSRRARRLAPSTMTTPAADLAGVAPAPVGVRAREPAAADGRAAGLRHGRAIEGGGAVRSARPLV